MTFNERTYWPREFHGIEVYRHLLSGAESIISTAEALAQSLLGHAATEQTVIPNRDEMINVGAPYYRVYDPEDLKFIVTSRKEPPITSGASKYKSAEKNLVKGVTVTDKNRNTTGANRPVAPLREELDGIALRYDIGDSPLKVELGSLAYKTSVDVRSQYLEYFLQPMPGSREFELLLEQTRTAQSRLISLGPKISHTSTSFDMLEVPILAIKQTLPSSKDENMVEFHKALFDQLPIHVELGDIAISSS